MSARRRKGRGAATRKVSPMFAADFQITGALRDPGAEASPRSGRRTASRTPTSTPSSAGRTSTSRRTATCPPTIRVAVTAAHFAEGGDGCDDNAIALAVREALAGEGSPYRDRFPAGFGIDETATEDMAWKLHVWARLDPPWDNFATLLQWRITEDDAIPAIGLVLYEDAAQPFTFDIPLA